MSSKKRFTFVTGKLPKVPTDQYKQRFFALAKTIDKDISVIYPAVFNEPTISWDDSIRADVANLMKCQSLHMLSNWQGHKRSEILRNVAMAIGIKIYYH